ncbi:MAG: LCP family protein [Lachnospiraceae bacterium]|nr:LCP family protein [Lachnospiraceae bacterium]
MKVLLQRKLSLVVLIVQLLVSVALCWVAFYVEFIPVKYVVAVIAVCAVLLLYQFLSQMTKSSYIIGRVLCVFFCLFFLGGGYYMYDTYAAVGEIGGAETKIDIISFYVLKDDKAQSIKDARDYTFGILQVQDRENTDTAMAEARTEAGQELKVEEYTDTATLVDALYAKEVQVAVFNQAFLDSVKEQYSTFEQDTRELVKHEIKTMMEQEDFNTDVTTKPFNVYISGVDVYGDISTTSRSDVNIIATVNPVTKKILLTTTPRDYYVPLYGKNGRSVSGGMRDKLTHAGIYGVDCSVNTLEKLYDIDIDYYVRVNFTSLRKIVDLLGGVEVYSDYDFISDWGPNGAGTHYKFKKGYNKVNGKKALAFTRERHHFGNGDYQRGRNHQHMIEALLNKVMSPSVLKDFSGLLKESKKMFQTSMSTKKIISLCRMQLNDMAQWKISYANAEGTGSKQYTYSMPSTSLYVCIPDMDSVQKISRRIKKVMAETEEDVEKDSSDSSEDSEETGEATATPAAQTEE